jgi:hypothetical protein
MPSRPAMKPTPIQENDMRKWNSEIYNDNHLRLMKCHIGMAVFYACLSGLLMAFDLRVWIFFAIGLFFPVILIHLVLSYGSYKRDEQSRKASEILFALMLLGFPVGTLLSMYFLLPATMWQAPDDK